MDHSELGLLTPSLHTLSKDVATILQNIKWQLGAASPKQTTDHTWTGTSQHTFLPTRSLLLASVGSRQADCEAVNIWVCSKVSNHPGYFFFFLRFLFLDKIKNWPCRTEPAKEQRTVWTSAAGTRSLLWLENLQASSENLQKMLRKGRSKDTPATLG